MTYAAKFRERMVRRMLPPEQISATALAREVGVGQATLSRWLLRATTVTRMGAGNSDEKREPKSTRRWSVQDKLRIVVEASTLSDAELGEFLRREGLYEAQLREWREAAEAALASQKRAKPAGSTAEAKHIRALEKELNRKDKALAELAALLTLKKKADAFWGDGDDDTPSRNDGTHSS